MREELEVIFGLVEGPTALRAGRCRGLWWSRRSLAHLPSRLTLLPRGRAIARAATPQHLTTNDGGAAGRAGALLCAGGERESGRRHRTALGPAHRRGAELVAGLDA